MPDECPLAIRVLPEHEGAKVEPLSTLGETGPEPLSYAQGRESCHTSTAEVIVRV